MMWRAHMPHEGRQQHDDWQPGKIDAGVIGDTPRFSASGGVGLGARWAWAWASSDAGRRSRAEFGAVGHLALAGRRPQPVGDVGPQARCPSGGARSVPLDRDPVPWSADYANICREWPRGWIGWPSFGRCITMRARSMKRATSFSRPAGSAGRARNIPTSARSSPGSRGRGMRAAAVRGPSRPDRQHGIVRHGQSAGGSGSRSLWLGGDPLPRASISVALWNGLHDPRAAAQSRSVPPECV